MGVFRGRQEERSAETVGGGARGAYEEAANIYPLREIGRRRAGSGDSPDRIQLLRKQRATLSVCVVALIMSLVSRLLWLMLVLCCVIWL